MRGMRHPDHAIDPLFVRRRSPRAMSGAPLPEAELLRLFEAARWAPSSSNLQPWRMAYALRGDAAFDALLGTAQEFNRLWAHAASALVVFCGQRERIAHDGTKKVARLCAFDVGAAWMSFALQGTQQGLVVHCMEGFDHEAARGVVHAPADVDVYALVAVGLPGDPAALPERNRAGEAPNDRAPIATKIARGRFT